MPGVLVCKLPDPSWGFPSVARIIPNHQNQWGRLVFLKGTVWEQFFPIIDPDIFDQAVRGHATPLMRVLGPPPVAFVKRLPIENGTCRNKGSCVNYSKDCVPGSKVPECWEPPEFPGEDTTLLSYVVQLWRGDVPVVILNPKE